MKMLNCIILALAVICLIFASKSEVEANDQPVLVEARTTYYSPSNSGSITATGCKVRYGICAVAKDKVGMTALVYSTDYELLGIFECLDTGGKAVQNGTIDIWFPTDEEGREWMELTKGKVLVQYIWAEG